jgi:hypothetical protein
VYEDATKTYIFNLTGGGYNTTEGPIEVSRVLVLKISGRQITHVDSRQYVRYVNATNGSLVHNYRTEDVKINYIVGIGRA